MAKAAAGRLRLEGSDVDIRMVISEAIVNIDVLAARKNIRLKQEILTTQTEVFADRIRLNQVFTNLLSNAVKFVPGKGEIMIEVKDYVHREDVLLVSVADNGEGIPQDKLKVLFNRFAQVDNSPTRKAGGTGLGLAIVKELITLHGGRVWVESEIGKGTVFYFTLLKAGKGNRQG